MSKDLVSMWKGGVGGWFGESARHSLASKGVKTGSNKMAGLPIFGIDYSRKELTVHRKGSHRKGYVKDVLRGKGVKLKRIASTEVKGATYKIKDVGAVGRGPKVIGKLRKGVMTREAIKLGYIREGEHVGDIPQSKFDNFARDLARHVGAKRAFRMLLAQKVFRKRAKDGFKGKIDVGLRAISSEYGEKLKPTEAIKARLKMGANPYGRG
jgi:hypothetical protein